MPVRGDGLTVGALGTFAQSKPGDRTTHLFVNLHDNPELDAAERHRFLAIITQESERLSRLIKQLKPDIVHAHDPHGVAMASLALSMVGTGAGIYAGRRVAQHYGA